ncbi:MAG: EAL domain-containing response regulator [Halothiobacillus sp.]
MMVQNLKILVIEDDDFQRRMIVNTLRTLGVSEICEAANGKQALGVLDSAVTRVDIALCDMNMPEMDGMEFMRHLGDFQYAPSILILSTLDKALLASIETMAKSYGIKLIGVVEKPIARAKLELLISQFERPIIRMPQKAAATLSFSLEEILLGMRANEFEPYFQPKVELKSGNITGAEALARWIHPEHGVISPYAFISLLEQSDNIDELTFIMLEKSAAACHLFHNRSNKITISVNLSLVSLNETDLAHKITTVVKNAGLDPRYIILEITESAIMTDLARALENLTRLCMHGFSLSIDDYGTGYSSMQQLIRVPFSELKIDQSFVKDFGNNEALRIVVESSIDMAHKLHLKSVAEGVETKPDLDMLKGIGCDIAQGYFIAKPMDSASFYEFCATYDATRIFSPD